ncbi:hypothetical protein EK21DRAFT_34187, partial [Setomelanomma holmii]
ANQLRFVNKQLYAETRGLELHFNELALYTLGLTYYFIQRCTPVPLGRVRALQFLYGPYWTRHSPMNADLQALISFCHRHRHVQVRSYLSLYSPNNFAMLSYFSEEEVMLRGTQDLMDALYAEGTM